MIAEFSKENNPNVRVVNGSYTLSNLKTLLSVADKEGFGVVACNIRSRFILNAVLEAAWQVKSPVILEIAESEAKYCNMFPARLSDLAHERIGVMIEKYGYSVPVCLHHDHVQKDVDGCVERAITAGFSSVELDLSKLPVEENAEKCKEVVAKLHPLGISLEVEDGEIGNADALADPNVEQTIDQYYSKVEDCKYLCEEVKPDALAFFVGNGHGNYLKKPIIGYDRIKEICDVVRPMGVYGVMHGGSGLLPENFNQCVASGARKFNYATSISDIWFKYFPEDLLARMDAKGEEMKRPRRKVLDLFEEEWDKLDFAEAEKAMTEHVAMMMEKAFLSSGKSELYN
ncbi:class II fructose-bisphosphate aldolase [Patescibacteria group bacterium]|nr:class II fructose-bisphosphate aldolase [Patescibacteria group bacterium]